MRSIKSIVKLFDNGSVCVCGLRGRGKDMLFANVIARRKKFDYVSNIDYGYGFHPYQYDDYDIGNTYENFVSGDIKPYVYPFPYGTDLYLSDCGIFFPSQYDKELDKKYKALTCFLALSRHLGRSNVHINSQSLERVWKKILEQSDTYLMCNKCVYIKPFRLVIQTVTLYEKYESACNNVHPCRLRKPLFCSASARLNYRMYLDNFENQHGKIKRFTVIYFNKSKYDTHHFETLLRGDLNA